MKIIFLDVDGVLNGYNKWNTLGFTISKKLHIEKFYNKIVNPFGVHESKVRRLAKIVQKTGAKIVMSSSWRHRYWKYCQSLNHKNWHYDTPFSNDIKKLYNLFKKYNIEVIAITPRICSCRRDKEISEFLYDYENTKHVIYPEGYERIDSYIILDDENTILPDYIFDPRFIQTSTVDIGHDIMGIDIEDAGLKRKHVKRAIRLLNR